MEEETYYDSKRTLFATNSSFNWETPLERLNLDELRSLKPAESISLASLSVKELESRGYFLHYTVLVPLGLPPNYSSDRRWIMSSQDKERYNPDILRWLSSLEGDLAIFTVWVKPAVLPQTVYGTPTVFTGPDASGRIVRSTHTPIEYKPGISAYATGYVNVFLYNPGIVRILHLFRSLEHDDIGNIKSYARDLPDHHRALAIEYCVRNNKPMPLSVLMPPEHSARFKEFYENTLRTGENEFRARDQDLLSKRLNARLPYRPGVLSPEEVRQQKWEAEKKADENKKLAVFAILGLIILCVVCGFIMALGS